MIADRSELIFLSTDDSTVLALDFPRAVALLGEPTRDDDGLSVFLGFVRLLALILQRNGHFGGSAQRSISVLVIN